MTAKPGLADTGIGLNSKGVKINHENLVLYEGAFTHA